ncbi:hypothetical protein [Nitrincola sp. MINF-07-Sa-05]|uniref:hypothetical protein n=1 Tax=Nitrincola salilacus TaxID=3400273 RepID=UPI0039184352
MEQEWVNFDLAAQQCLDSALSLFQQARFAEAAILFKRLLEQEPQQLYRFYLDYCIGCQKHPEQDFDGTLRLTSK